MSRVTAVAAMVLIAAACGASFGPDFQLGDLQPEATPAATGIRYDGLPASVSRGQAVALSLVNTRADTVAFTDCLDIYAAPADYRSGAMWRAVQYLGPVPAIGCIQPAPRAPGSTRAYQWTVPAGWAPGTYRLRFNVGTWPALAAIPLEQRVSASFEVR